MCEHNIDWDKANAVSFGALKIQGSLFCRAFRWKDKGVSVLCGVFPGKLECAVVWIPDVAIFGEEFDGKSVVAVIDLVLPVNLGGDQGSECYLAKE